MWSLSSSVITDVLYSSTSDELMNYSDTELCEVSIEVSNDHIGVAASASYDTYSSESAVDCSRSAVDGMAVFHLYDSEIHCWLSSIVDEFECFKDFLKFVLKKFGCDETSDSCVEACCGEEWAEKSMVTSGKTCVKTVDFVSHNDLYEVEKRGCKYVEVMVVSFWVEEPRT